MPITVEQVFRTEGVPEYTFVRPPNFNDILIDVRTEGKPVIVEGQSGTGKSTVTKKILREVFPSELYEYLTPRQQGDLKRIEELSENPGPGLVIIDDFHRLTMSVQIRFGNIVKLAAESADPSQFPKLVIIGINQVGSSLINLVHDLGKRIGIHRVQQASKASIIDLIERGERELNISIENKSLLYDESKGDYWLTQLLAQNVCLLNNVLERQITPGTLKFTVSELRHRVTSKLEHAYDQPIREFCRGRRFRPTNDPYFKLLVAVSKEHSSIVDLTELANANPEVRGSINNIKEARLGALIAEKPICARYFYYNNQNKNLAIEDPALFYYLKIVDWEKIKKECGFRSNSRDFEFDYALSFAGEQRKLAREIAEQLEILDCSVFFDESFEVNYLGRTWSGELKKIFTEKSRLVVCLLDLNHKNKIWPTFERDCFLPRVTEGEVIPIFLDDTVFPGIPNDLIGIKFTPSSDPSNLKNKITDEIIWKLADRLAA